MCWKMLSVKGLKDPIKAKRTLKGTIVPKLANHPAWRSRLIIGIHNSESDYSRTSREHLTRSLENYVKEKNELNQKAKFKKYEKYVVGSFKGQ